MPDLTTTTTDPADVDADLLVLAVSEARARARRAPRRGPTRRVGGVLRRAAGDERFRAKLGQTLVVHVRDVRAQRIALVGLGAGRRPRRARRCASRPGARRASRRPSARRASPSPGRCRPRRASDARACEVAAEGALLGSYRFDKYLTDDRGRSARDDDVHPAAARRRRRRRQRTRVRARALDRARGRARARSRQRARRAR